MLFYALSHIICKDAKRAVRPILQKPYLYWVSKNTIL
jgi:hypothetical protein